MLQELIVYDLPLSVTGGTPSSRGMYPQALFSHYYVCASFSACASVHGSGLVNRRNQCSLNASMQFFRHWPLFFECAIAANAKWEAAVAQLRTSAPKLPPKGAGRHWFCVVLIS